MKFVRFFLMILALLSLLPVSAAQAEVDSYHDHGIFPIDETIWNECTGEEVHLTGSLVWSSHEVVTKSGTIQWGYQTRYQGVKGVGLTSGMIYQGNSGEHGYGTTVEDPALPYHYSAAGFSTVRLVSQGSAPNLVIKHLVRVVVTPDFEWQVSVFSDEVTCK